MEWDGTVTLRRFYHDQIWVVKKKDCHGRLTLTLSLRGRHDIEWNGYTYTSKYKNSAVIR